MKLKVLAGMLVATTALAFSPIDDLNKALVELLKPINNNVTSAKLAFTSLDIADNKINSAAAYLDYSKSGELSDLNFKPNVSYSNGEIAANLTTHVDLVAVVGQETINELGPAAEAIVRDTANNFITDFGDAATVDVKTTEEKYDNEGNLTMLSVVGEMQVDMNRLPEDVSKEEVVFTRATLAFTVGLDTLSVQGVMTLNPASVDVQVFEQELLERLKRLIEQDDRTMTDLQEFVKTLDGIADDLVNEGF